MTYSILARCPETGAFGMAITSSSICVASRCAWTSPLGVVATQNLTNPALGPFGLTLLRQGAGAASVLATVLKGDPDPSWRQVAVIDRYGSVAWHSGENAMPHRGAVTGPGCIALGNILANDAVPGAMMEKFKSSEGLPLAERLMQALEAGLEAGGEIADERGAGLQVSHIHDWPVVDLRVDWHDEPIGELRRLWTLYAPIQRLFVARAIAPGEELIAED